ncbi:YqkE family protein [Lysinibacillus odysseyi]|uniref:DUF3886 domain-containing protein n=1 Tax=Lysinibacillus odysseyi 34hs-1 = NBRC 100172 TaxID=1220589 RepID=A0A0A3IJC9_9BACI|nr:YqkE family protein [Lysinibacillus odysseyi]KGR84851.1 hypothetical protein CD32_10335 [Lysinibacillus odysseyi 34hs-1 = NBRC 100172]
MAKKKGQQQAGELKQEKDQMTLADQLGGDVLAKLKEAKQSLAAEEQKKEEERQAKLAFERKQREKNMSFEELLDQYGSKGSKY